MNVLSEFSLLNEVTEFLKFAQYLTTSIFLEIGNFI